MTKSVTYFKNLDAIRFFAAMMVFLSHSLSDSYSLLHIEGSMLMSVLKLASTGGIGVSIFFVLSGFLITYLLISEHEQTGEIALAKFYLRRVLRIWPLYYVVVIFAFLLYPFLKNLMNIPTNSPTQPELHIMFLSNFDVLRIFKEGLSKNLSALESITWSVSIEEQFYLFWPLIFTYLPRKYWHHSILLVIAISIAFRLFHQNDIHTLYYHTLSVFVDLGMGSIFAYYAKSNKRFRAYFENATPQKQVIFFLIPLIILLNTKYFTHIPYAIALMQVLITFFFAMNICFQALTKRDTIFNLGRYKLPSKWGKYTYGIYLLHPIALLMTDIYVRLIHLERNNFLINLIIAGLGFVFTILIAKLSFLYFEARFLRLKNRLG